VRQQGETMTENEILSIRLLNESMVSDLGKIKRNSFEFSLSLGSIKKLFEYVLKMFGVT